jgi:S1-C subfamily serine protease
MKKLPTPFALPLYLIATLALTLNFSIPVFAQSTAEAKPFEITYYDKDWKQVTDRKKAVYFRHVFKTDDPERVLVKDFYISGKPQYECFVTDYDIRDGNKLAMDGTCRWFNEDGSLSSESEYKSGKQEGLSKIYNEDGTLTLGYFVNDEREGPFNVVDPEGNLVARYVYEQGIPGKFDLLCGPARCAQLYSEEFYDRAVARDRDWLFDPLTTFRDSGGLRVELDSENEAYQVNLLGIDYSGRWYMSSKFRFGKTKGRVEQGILFGASGSRNLVAFVIGSDGTASIYDRRNGVDKPLLERKRVASFLKGDKENTISVSRDENGFEFSINQEVVHRLDELRWYGGDAGIFSSVGVGEINVSNFFYMAPTEKPTDTSLKPPTWWSATGSGFILSTEGYIVTNHHVIDGATRIEVDVRTGDEWKSVSAEVVAFDAASDLAILKLDAESLGHIKEIPFPVKTDLADLGTKVFTLGFPATRALGDEMKFTEGSVSARSGYRGDVTAYQVSVPLHGGNSGGPLFDIEGNLIGVVNAGVPSMQNVGYAIKSSYLMDMIRSMDRGPRIPTQNKLEQMSQTERIKALSELVVFIKVKD